MYNKYFTMKRSELKEAIKAEIKSVLSEELEKFQMTYNGDPVHIKVQGFGGNAEGPKDKILFVNIGDMGKRHISTQNALEKRLGLLDQEVTGIMFTDKDNTSKEIKDISKDDFKITSVLSEDFNEPLMKMIGLKEVYQTNSKMSQMVSLFQEMMADEYDGIEVPKAFDDFVPKFFEAINMDYESAENFGEKVSNIREEDEMTDAEKKKAAEKDAKKEKIGKQASKLSQADEDRYERIKNGLEKLKKKGDEESIKRMKAILGKEDVQRLIKAKGRKEKSFM